MATAPAAVLALVLRLFQLSRPGDLSGFTQYDDGVYFGNAVRLVHGAIAYRNFAMVRPPGSMLLMALVARGRARFAGPFVVLAVASPVARVAASGSFRPAQAVAAQPRDPGRRHERLNLKSNETYLWGV